MTKRNDTVDNLSVERKNEFSKFYLAITIIMSKCKYIICTSGNCSLWIMFYRENANNVFQNLNDDWFYYKY
jgi:roadblock/LC7 domain-containing protein